MRKHESLKVEKSLKDLGINLKVVDASYQFYQGHTTFRTSNQLMRDTKMLSMSTNPEEKRKIIGDIFVVVANEIVKELNLKPEEVFFGQGTLRPDLIESASSLVSGKAETIKTHHNDTELIR